jgi:hypothetical protein
LAKNSPMTQDWMKAETSLFNLRDIGNKLGTDSHIHWLFQVNINIRFRAQVRRFKNDLSRDYSTVHPPSQANFSIPAEPEMGVENWSIFVLYGMDGSCSVMA